MKHIALIVGGDDFLVEDAAKKFRLAALGPDAAPTATEVVYGDATNEAAQLESISRCRDSWQTPAFFDPVKLTWWRNVAFLPGGGNSADDDGAGKRKLAESVKAALEKFAKSVAASGPPENQYLLITAPALLQTSIFAKNLAKVADVTVFTAGGRPEQEKQQAAIRLESFAAAEGLSFQPAAKAAFIEKVGPDSRTIVSELAKLRTWLGDEKRDVTEEDVAEIISSYEQETEIWALADAFARRDPKKAAAVWHGYEGDKNAGIPVSVYMEKTFREWIVYADAIEHGWLSPDGTWSKDIPAKIVDDLAAAGMGPKGAKRSFADKKAAGQVAMFKRRNPRGYVMQLRKGRFLMLKLRERLTMASLEPRQVELELLRACTI